MLGFNKKQVQEKEQEIIDFTELGSFIDTPIKYYSSGMSVRLAFTIATMIDPEILVFDEMLSAGDAAFMQKAKKRMDELIDKAKILALVSHDLELIKSLCNRCILLKHGQIVMDGKPGDVVPEYLRAVTSGAP
jgi:ABC-type polysaccharide/polyol phosphate transport system ATPase subunit